MKKAITPTQLRANLFQILDEVLETGHPCEIDRGGRKLLIVPGSPVRRDLARLPKRQALNCDPEDLVRPTLLYEHGEDWDRLVGP